MPHRTVRVADPAGLHARPAASLVKAAGAFAADVRIQHREREANAKSIVDVLTLDVGQGADVTIVTEGADADEALEHIAGLVAGEPTPLSG
jgi:phosphocarrier protein HPr